MRRSVEQSLERLGRPTVTLLQLHNGLTARREDEPFSITPADVLGADGVLDAFREVKAAGLVRFIGLTGTGQPEAMRAVVRSGGFDTIQVPYNVLNPKRGVQDGPDSSETDYGNVIADCSEMDVGVLAIRVFAGGALLDQPPSAQHAQDSVFPTGPVRTRSAASAERIDRLGHGRIPRSASY